MKSGDFDREISEQPFAEAIDDIRDHEFVQHTFYPRAALIAKQPVNGHRMWKEFKGEAFDASEFDKVEGHWDHEHCSICWLTIRDGHTYWSNSNAVKILCDACYEEYAKRRANPPLQPTRQKPPRG